MRLSLRRLRLRFSAGWCVLGFLYAGLSPSYGQPPGESTPVRLGQFGDFEELNLEDLLDVRVSIAAAGQSHSLEEAPSIVSVITDEDIRRRGFRTLEELLRTVPGFEVVTDNLGRNRITVRGVPSTTSENILILYNGHRLNEHITGGGHSVNLSIPLFNVKQVEVIRGPGSALFGSNAYVGVVSLITYSAENFSGTEVSVGGGSFGTQEYSVVTAHGLGDWGLSASFQIADTNGPELNIPSDAQTLSDRLLFPLGFPQASLAPGKTRGARSSQDIAFNSVYKGLRVSGRIRNEDSAGFIGAVDVLSDRDRLDTRQILLDVSQQTRLRKGVNLAAKFSFTQNEIAQFLGLLPPGVAVFRPDRSFSIFPDGVTLDFDLKSRRFGGEAAFELQLSERNLLVTGVGLETEGTYDQETRGNFDIFTFRPLPSVQRLPFNVLLDSQREIFSLFAQNTAEITQSIAVTAGVRYDRYSDFGDTLNPRLGVVWRLPGGLYFKALYGRAFRAPSFSELWFSIPGAIEGNPGTQSTSINTGELSMGLRQKNFRLSANVFAKLMNDFIVPTRPLASGGEVGEGALTFLNYPKLSVKGVEVELQRTFGVDHTLFFNYTYQNAGDDRGVQFANVPAHLLNMGGTFGMGRYLGISPIIMLRGRQPRSPLESLRPHPVPGYGLVNLSVGLRNVFETLELSGALFNLFDKKFYDPAPLGKFPGDYPRQGRNLFMKVAYKF